MSGENGGERGGERGRFGIYSGVVHSVSDPEASGRIQVVVPHVMGLEVLANWAVMGGQHFGLPASPRRWRRSPGRGTFRVPPVGSQVMVMFLDGDVQAPVWFGGVWPRDAVPAVVKGSGYPSKSLLAAGEKLEVVEDSAGDITVAVAPYSDNMAITVDTRGGDVEVRTDGRGGGVIRLQQGLPGQNAARITDPVSCGTIGPVFAPGGSVVIGLVYTPPIGPPVTMVSGGIPSTPIIGRITGGASKVLMGD